MKITEADRTRFKAWMLARGRSEDTADLYLMNLGRCASDPKGLTHRLVGGELSPNTRRTNLASLAAWARFTKDTDLRDQLEEIRLPPARRVTVKLPLAFEDWRKMVAHLQTCKLRTNPARTKAVNLDAMRQVLLIIAIRGPRVGDVLRIRRKEVLAALETGVLSYEGKGRKRHEWSAAPIRPQLAALAKITGWNTVRELVTSGTTTHAAISRVEAQYRAEAKKLKIPNVHPHRFRRTFATQYLAELKGDPQALMKLQKYMGWASLATAAKYADAVDQRELDTIGAGLVSGLLK